MCECLVYADGDAYLCVPCAGMVRECPHCGPAVLGGVTHPSANRPAQPVSAQSAEPPSDFWPAYSQAIRDGVAQAVAGEKWKAAQLIARLMAAVAEQDPGEPAWIEQAMREAADYVEEAKKP